MMGWFKNELKWRGVWVSAPTSVNFICVRTVDDDPSGARSTS